jgi:glutamate---cysteine ligase / carboxylate-amine ligase
MSDDFKFGIEEEYFLVDAETKAVAVAPPEAFLMVAKKEIGPQIKGEMLRSQIECTTDPHVDIARARAELKHLRHALAAVAAKYGLAVLASGTHPTAVWECAQQTPTKRYDAVMHDLQMIGQRNMLCGTHIHVELPDPDGRVDVMYRMLPYLPLFVALATSSPFWQSRPTGLKGYRLAAYDELPRTGVPELFRRREDFDAYISALTRSGVIPDSSFVWWAIRPSLQHNTLELRAPDSCTSVEDSVAIASLYRSLVRMLSRLPSLNGELTAVSRAIVVENKWRAQRYGIHGTFATEGGAESVPAMLERVIADITPDAKALDCMTEVEHCWQIVKSGTSADRQLAVFAMHEKCEGRARALSAVTDWIAAASLHEGAG